MKKVLGVVTTVLMVVGVLKGVAGAEATVYNASNSPVARTAATAERRLPVKNIGLNQAVSVDVKATLPCQLTVGISNSKVDWTINSVGDYILSAAQIDVSTNINSPVTMNVAGAENLHKKEDSKQTLDTYYCLKTTSDLPNTREFTAAAAFNGDKKIPVSNGAGTAYLWNRVNAVSGKSSGTYSDDFLVTFSQNL